MSAGACTSAGHVLKCNNSISGPSKSPSPNPIKGPKAFEFLSPNVFAVPFTPGGGASSGSTAAPTMDASNLLGMQQQAVLNSSNFAAAMRMQGYDSRPQSGTASSDAGEVPLAPFKIAAASIRSMRGQTKANIASHIKFAEQVHSRSESPHTHTHTHTARSRGWQKIAELIEQSNL